jgi:hypothetical protein
MKRKIDEVHAEREAPGEEGRVFEQGEVTQIAANMKTHGFAIFRAVTDAECDEQIIEIWQKIILALPFKEPLVVRSKNGHALDPVHHRAQFLEIVKAKLTPAQRKEFRAKAPLHVGFGASCDPASFLRDGNYAIRQDPGIYAIAAAILGFPNLWFDLNRTIAKLPGEGEDEFLHWDLDAFFGTFASAPSSVSGKVCFSDSRFVAVPGTHTPEFQRAFLENYKQLYPRAKPNAAKTALAFDKPDPLRLIHRTREYPVPAGCCVLWNTQLLHGQKKTPLDHPIEYGIYLGYMRAASRPAYARKCGVHELDDRIRAFLTGTAPLLWPSFDTIHFYPFRYKNFPKLLQAFIDKLREDHPSITTRSTKDGKVVPHLEPWPVTRHVPFELSPLGRMLLGLDPWPLESCGDY